MCRHHMNSNPIVWRQCLYFHAMGVVEILKYLYKIALPSIALYYPVLPIILHLAGILL